MIEVAGKNYSEDWAENGVKEPVAMHVDTT